MAAPAFAYVLVRTFTRRIPKFNVEGTEYRLRVNPINRDIPYGLVVEGVYDVFDRKYIT